MDWTVMNFEYMNMSFVKFTFTSGFFFVKNPKKSKTVTDILKLVLDIA